jgi:sugar lactone lactonase YvrE
MRRTLLILLTLVGAPLFAHPSVSVVFDSRGNLYYSDLTQVWRVAPDGTRSVAVPNVHAHELAVDAQDNLYGEHLWYEGERTDKWGHYVWRRAPDGRVSYVIPRTEGFLKNYSFVRDRAGNMYWPDRDLGEIRKRAPNGAITTLARGLKNVRWMTSSPDGTLFLIDLPDLVRITPDGRVTRLVRKLSDSRHDVQGLWVDAAGNVYVAHTSERAVKRINSRGEVTIVAKSTFPWAPTGGGFARDGAMWVLEASVTNQQRVRKLAH